MHLSGTFHKTRNTSKSKFYHRPDQANFIAVPFAVTINMDLSPLPMDS